MRKFLGVCILMGTLLFASLGIHATISVPKPTKEYFVNDYAFVLSGETKAHIIEKNKEINKIHGVSIVFVTVDYLPANIVDYSYALFNDWKIGSKERNNGILVVLAIQDDDYYVMLGDGWGNRFSPSYLDMLLNAYLEPDFAIKDYDAGAYKLFDALYDKALAVYKNGRPLQTGDFSESAESALWAISIFVLSMGMLYILFKKNNEEEFQNDSNNQIDQKPVFVESLRYRRRQKSEAAKPANAEGWKKLFDISDLPVEPRSSSQHSTNYHPSSTWSSGGSSFRSSSSSSRSSSSSSSHSSSLSSSSRSSGSSSINSGGSSRGSGAGRR